MRKNLNNSDCRRRYCSPTVEVVAFRPERKFCASVAIDNTMYFVDMKEIDLSDYWED